MYLSFFLPFLINSFHSSVTSKSPKGNLFSEFDYKIPNTYSFILDPGRYKITCYGAQGGFSYYQNVFGNNGGKGAVVSGFINISGENQKFYANVGGMGKSRKTGLMEGGYNGGGYSGWCKKWKHHFHSKQYNNGPGSGGGATDVRYGSNDISNRIIVAAGGSGGSYNINGAPGGDLTGYNYYGPSQRTTQTLGGINGQGSDGNTAKSYPSSGGGGGYRGGAEGFPSESDPIGAVSDSGSSYISGYPGCAPYPNITFEYPQMSVGLNYNDGRILIEAEYTCEWDCLKCYDNYKCLECKNGYILYDERCYSTCPSGTIHHPTYCEKCEESCYTCSGIPNNCTSCSYGYYYYEGKCLKICPNGYYGYDYNRKCIEECPNGTYVDGSFCKYCNKPCSTCIDNPTKCTNCIVEKYLFNHQCVDECPERTVREGNKCITECPNNQFLYNQICYTTCPKGTYINGIICEDCSSDCTECEGDASICTKCSHDMVLVNSSCIKNCPSDKFFYNNRCLDHCPFDTFYDENRCVDYCSDGKYAVDDVCIKCNSNCASCINSSNICTSCKEETYLYDNQCLDHCYENLYIYNNKCVNECPPGTFLSFGICENMIEYYNSKDIHKKVPRASKTVIIIFLPILVIAFVAQTVVLVFLILNYYC